MPPLAELLPSGRVTVDVSLWSANLGALAAEIDRLAPYADLFHLDASDARLVPDQLFFPDLVAALRPRTTTPFHVHLMAERACPLVFTFAAAGADLITVHAEAHDAADALRLIRSQGRCAGLALSLASPLQVVEPHVRQVDAIVLVGTPLGTRGSTMDPGAPARVADLRRLLAATGHPAPAIFADGGIRASTVPPLIQAGADALVVGSALTTSTDPAATIRWLHSHAATDFPAPAATAAAAPAAGAAQ